MTAPFPNTAGDGAAFTPAEWELLRGSVSASQRRASEAFAAAPKSSPEQAYYGQQLDALEALRAKLDAPLIADTSQDADDEDDAS